MSTQPYLDTLKTLSNRLVNLQKPIRILDAIKWTPDIEQAFRASGGRALPRVDADYYQRQPLGFDPEQLDRELLELDRDIRRQLGRGDALGKILQATVEQYQLVVQLLRHRGRPEFGDFSRQLYGSASDRIRGDRKTLRTLGERLCEVFSLPAVEHLNRPYRNDIDAETAVSMLRQRMDRYFGRGQVRVAISDDIVSDAAAGGDGIKVNRRAHFSELDIQVLEVHEGWVHIGTTLNGREQPWATWLSVGSPRITAIQEGMAVLMETLTFSSFPQRARRVSDRVVAVDLAEQGADFCEVYRHFLDRGVSEHDSYRVTQRVFRGGQVAGDQGSVFTKDISYVKGFVENVNFIRSAIQSGVPEIIPMLFVGKVTLDDLPLLYERYLEGVISAPRHVPPMFRDLNGLYVWFGFSSSLSLMNIARIQQHFSKLFDSMPATAPLYAGSSDTKRDAELD
ncbi:flavohemoglobin expression-modulating QEGLA motif protein [Marinimicrobium agarilyticum]|uniref:flavohemoglobin expression-modulating QEGLA motif protein n=1 Tax=Marinimicrobium agarilyticum TaxID=306546 RepID=UPI0003FC1B9E|nr:flavohemoglobin expression-modulating QEGLA motif protein [Marinimicrobium agarilyticum]